jgi:LPXTG-site transpeptidase (sortase) family protein
MKLPERRYEQVNRFLALVVIGGALYLTVAPFWPEITYALRFDSRFAMVRRVFPWLRAEHAAPSVAGLITPRVSMAAGAEARPVEPIPDVDMLVIPSIGVRSPIVQGKDSGALSKGSWLRPNSSTPDKGGNTVLAGHRFLYTSGENTFYHLDKLHPNDTITVYWQKRAYHYKVETTSVVQASAVEIEAPSSQPVLTLYTCTPLFKVDKRLVIRAVPIE